MKTKTMQMLEFEIEACRRNIDYLREQMGRGKEEKFYTEQLSTMQGRLETLKEAKQAWKYY